MRRAGLVMTALASAIACHDDIAADSGADALMQVASAQFRRGPMPLENGTGPTVGAATLQSQAEAGRGNLVGAGDVSGTATGIAIGLQDDVGFWTIPARTPSSGLPTDPTWSLTYGLASTLQPGTYNYVLRAVDASGNFGPTALRPLTILPRRVPAGRLVISLTWDSQVDLDLHVLLPNGVEMYKRRPAEYEPPPISAGPQDPFAIRDGGILDRDSNSRCIQDGQRSENAVWVNPPPTGHYQIRVDTFSMCGGSSASWRLAATYEGRSLGSASGTATESDLRFSHDRGAGVLALEIDVP